MLSTGYSLPCTVALEPISEEHQLLETWQAPTGTGALLELGMVLCLRPLKWAALGVPALQHHGQFELHRAHTQHWL